MYKKMVSDSVKKWKCLVGWCIYARSPRGIVKNIFCACAVHFVKECEMQNTPDIKDVGHETRQKLSPK